MKNFCLIVNNKIISTFTDKKSALSFFYKMCKHTKEFLRIEKCDKPEE